MRKINPSTTVTLGTGVQKDMDGGVEAAIAAAKAADVVVLALGTATSTLFGDPFSHAFSSSSITRVA